MWNRSGTVLTISSRALIRAYEDGGGRGAQILESAGISPGTFADPDARIPGATFATLWNAACRRSDDPDLALHAVEAVPFGAYRVIDFLLSNAPRVGAAVERLSRYFPLINTGVRLPIEEGRAVVAVGVEDVEGAAILPLAYAAYCLAAVYRHTRDGTGGALRLQRVTFTHPSPPHPEAYERVFECPVTFGEPRTALHVARAVWDRPVERADPLLSRVLEEYAGLLVAGLPEDGSLTATVREFVSQTLRQGEASLESVATQLAMSPRSLQRKLRQEGSSYAEVLDEVRSTLAKSHLQRRDLSVCDVGYLLGFAEHSAFCRAFKRWTGCSPRQFRSEF